MSFIPKQDKTPRIRHSIQLRQNVSDQAKRYAAYLESDLDHVVEQLLLKAFKADREFQKHEGMDKQKTLPKSAPKAEKVA